MPTISDADLQLLFLDAHTAQGWLDQPVDDALLRRLYEVLRLAPTSGNSQPMRAVFVKSVEAKERLKPALSPGNVNKVMTSPVTAIIAQDLEFHERLPFLSPSRPAMRDQVAGMPAEKRERMGFQSATLQAGYLILAARGLGLDVAPMGGFDPAKVDAAFFPEGKWKASLLIALGHADPTKFFPRAPRLEFDEACRIA